MARVLVDLDTLEGLSDSFQIYWEEYILNQCLDYEGILFRCLICHDTGHVKRKCKLGFGKNLRRRYSSSLSAAILPNSSRRTTLNLENTRFPGTTR